MKLALILPLYNHLDYTQKTLQEVTDQIDTINNHDIYIILIDDGSSDGTSDWIKNNYQNAILLNGDGNLWWSGAINLGAKYAIENLVVDYIVLWNNDIHIDESYFQSLVRILEVNNQAAIIGSKIYVADKPGLLWSMGGYFNPKNGNYGMYGYFTEDTDDFGKIMEVDWLTGMGTIISKKVIEKIGYWDNVNFPQYHGDSDFTYRAKKAGFSIIVHPWLKIYNNIKNSGIEHQGSFKQLLQLFTSIRSKSNLSKNLRFYRLHATTIRAFLPLFWLYFRVVGGFYKKKIVSLFTIKTDKLAVK
jgi:GT2 family glycosyltransferase